MELRQGKSDETVSINLSVYRKSGARMKTLELEGGSEYAKVKDKDGKRGYYDLVEGKHIIYRAVFDVKGAQKGKTTPLSAPVFDDITIFYPEGIRIVSYAEQAG